MRPGDRPAPTLRKFQKLAHHLCNYAQMMDWDDLRVFAVLAETGSLSATARQLGIEHSTVARRITALETALGLKLFDRLARGYRLTTEGERIAAETGAVREAMFAVERAAKGVDMSLAGSVRISAPPSVATGLIAPALPRLLMQHPGIAVELVGEKAFANLAERDADIALRLSRPGKGRLAIRKLGTMRFGLYGARDYIATTDEADYAFCGYDEALDQVPQQLWLKRRTDGRPLDFRTNELATLQAAVAAGMGLAVLPHFLARNDARLRCLEEADGAEREIWLVLHPDVKTSARVQAVRDFLVEAVPAAFG